MSNLTKSNTAPPTAEMSIGWVILNKTLLARCPNATCSTPYWPSVAKAVAAPKQIFDGNSPVNAAQPAHLTSRKL